MRLAGPATSPAVAGTGPIEAPAGEPGPCVEEEGAAEAHALVVDVLAELCELARAAAPNATGTVLHEATRRIAALAGHADLGRSHRRRDELVRALDRQEFVVHYQPVLDLASGRMVGVEALARWEHPERGLLQPGDFLADVQRLGLMSRLGRQLLDRACSDGDRWHRYLVERPLQVAVNVSGQQLKGDLAGEVSEALAVSGLPATSLMLEIPEDALASGHLALGETLTWLRAQGVRVAVDDFGAGHSSLRAIRDLPVDVLKIDRSFLAEITSGDGDAPVVATVIDLAHRLGLQVVAVGVERMAQLTFLRRAGCDAVQGFALARPMDVASVERHLAQQRLASENHTIPALPTRP